MKPIPDDVPIEVAHLAQELRELIGETLPPDVPTSAIAKAAGIGRSTLFHALSGHRVPTVETVLMVVNACEAARAEPDIVVRHPDGSVHVAEVKNNRMTPLQKQLWTALVDHARHPVSRPEVDVNLLLFPGHTMGKSELLGSGLSGTDDMDRGAARQEAVSITAAAAMLDRAMRRLEQATQDVTQARAVLTKAIAASTTGAETPATVAQEAARDAYTTMRKELLDAEQRRERDQPASGEVEGNVEP
ncbi:hypothetical protein AQJ43_37765 [Streptomyces avermitilis]|uniref:Uncharacterized protein n=2 Tax=Streptomyces avermitilis TaxID=33903 RepID=A0A143T0Q3_STRAW|nr:hypothetical protein [Streptomyces avermitilis]KUN46663.1 hypothetical protein AQJ43_37765 [Streptomyces avermitilis]BAU77593.1 hypothetical protein SAVERM_2p150 [Streptomyces avermitilis MA-4680 = NBRC 14893]GDY70260.1 hypothetical protein SAV14893_096530 [Streptomyces avermitilis]GDY80568.1 hypothetical protein SAV31267_100530 [Streptomyces avermitilis]